MKIYFNSGYDISGDPSYKKIDKIIYLYPSKTFIVNLLAIKSKR